MRIFKALTLCLSLSLLACSALQAADNELTAEEKAAGWRLLFNGKDHTGWKCSNDKPVGSAIEEASLVPHKSGGYLIVYDEQFDDFVFKCDVKMGEECNSGIFFRVGDLKDPVQTGFEVQVITGDPDGYHAFGAIYDLGAPTKKAHKGPGEWNTVEIRCEGPQITVSVNGEKVSHINCDEFTEPGKRPDGTKHKFKQAVRDFPRKGYLGLQDHGHKVWFKNVKLKEL